jgi:hypothetical protein
MMMEYFGPLSAHQINSFELSNEVVSNFSEITSGRNIAEELNCKFYHKRSFFSMK